MTPEPTATDIVPRWEWRAFGFRFPQAERMLGALSAERVQESVDVYLVGTGTERRAVKVRDGLMDVKQLEHVDERGLEQWVPVTKEEFPLSGRTLERVLGDLGTTWEDTGRGDYSIEEALAVATDTGDLVTVETRKRRVRYKVAGCLAELTSVHATVGSACTIALESEDPDKVVEAAQMLGLDGVPNVSYPRWLARLAGLDAARFAVIDVGTNSVKFHVGERAPAGTWSTVLDRAEVTRLGEGLDREGSLQDEPRERTTTAIASMVEDAQRVGVVGIAAVGTAGLRMAANSAVFVDAVEERCGIRIEVISGEDEARLAYVATTSALSVPSDGRVVVFDSGGGSTQFTFGRGTTVNERFSVNVGAARFTDRFGLDRSVSDDVLREAGEAIAGDLGVLDDRPSPDALVGMGGAMTNLAAVSHGLARYDPEIVQGTVLEVAEVDRQIEMYRARSAEERRAIVGLQPDRAPVILAGACIVRSVMAKLDVNRVTVSDRSLRHGLIVERFGLPTARTREHGEEKQA